MKQGKKVLFLTRGKTTPSSRYRVFNYVAFLQEEGFDITVIPFPKNFLRMFALMAKILKADVTVVQKKILHTWEIYFMNFLSRALVYDLDDLATERPKKEKDKKKNISVEKRFWLTVKFAKGLILGNNFLKQYIESKHSDKDIAQIPTPIDTDEYLPKESYEAKTVTIGWIGLPGNLLYFDIMKQALVKLANEFDIELKIICSEFIDIEGVKIVKKKWVLDEVVEDLRSCDIGIMPLNTDKWAEAKCGFKAIQCMGVALPVVVSPVGINKDIIVDGENGFLAKDIDQWYDKLKKLVADKDLRERLGKKGRKTVEEGYSFDVCSKRLKNFLEKI